MEYLYAALLLHKLGKPINADSIGKVISAAGAQADEAKVKTLIAALNGVDITAEMEKAVVVGVPSAAGAGEAKKEEKKEEEKPSESAAGLASLFG